MNELHHFFTPVLRFLIFHEIYFILDLHLSRFASKMISCQNIHILPPWSDGLQADAPEGACHDNVWKVFWNIFHFCHRWIWCGEKIKEYLTFYAYFTRMQKFFHFRRWEFFFQKTAVFFREKMFFVNVFSKMIDDNRS